MLGTLVINEIVFHITHIRLINGFIQFDSVANFTRPAKISKEPDMSIFAPDGTLIATLRYNPEAPVLNIRPGLVTWRQDVRVTDRTAEWITP